MKNLKNQIEQELKLGVMVIGLGTHAKRGHIDYFEKLGIELIAAVDTSATARTQFSLEYPGEYYLGDDHLQFLADPLISAVFIMTPDRFHAQQTFDCLKHGKHVFCEKPMADHGGLALLEESIQLAKQNNLVLTSCHPRRFDPPFVWLKNQIEGLIAQFGLPQEFRFDFSYAKPTKFGLHTGLLADHLNHEVDLMHFLFDKSSFKADRLIDQQDRYCVNGIRHDGLAFSFSGTRRLNSSVYSESTWIRFERGEIALNALQGTAQIYDHDCGTNQIIECGKTDYNKRFSLINLNFKQAIRGLADNYLTPDDLMVNTKSGVELTARDNWCWNFQETH